MHPGRGCSLPLSCPRVPQILALRRQRVWAPPTSGAQLAGDGVHSTAETGCTARRGRGAHTDGVHSTLGTGCTACHGRDAQHVRDGVHNTTGTRSTGWQRQGAQQARDGVLSQTSNQQHPTSSGQAEHQQHSDNQQRRRCKRCRCQHGAKKSRELLHLPAGSWASTLQHRRVHPKG